MALRLVKILVPRGEEDGVLEILGDHGPFPTWSHPVSEDGAEVHALLPAEGNDPVLEALRSRLEHIEGFRLVLLPVQATVPRMEEPDVEEEEPTPSDDEAEKAEKPRPRINLEELYTSLVDDARATPLYLTLVALSTVVACAGLMMGDTAVIIGAMVIAPLLGPNMALAFATTRGDLDLGRSAARTAAAGAFVALAVAVAGGLAFTVDPGAEEIASRTRVSGGHVALALAAGAAGVLSLTRGVAAGLVGVMVAVALLPPLAAAGLLLGDGRWTAGVGALLLLIANVACVNLAGIGTFLAQGVRPRAWQEEKRKAKKATTVAVLLWAGLVATLLLVFWLAWGE